MKSYKKYADRLLFISREEEMLAVLKHAFVA